MLRLCALILLPSFAWAAQHSLSTTFTTDSRNGPLDIADLSRNFQISQSSQTIRHTANGVLDNLGTTISLTATQPDYTSVLLTDETGTTRPLSDSSSQATELSLELGTNWAKGADALSFSWLGHVSESPFSSQSITAGYIRSFNQQSTLLGIDALYARKNQPISFFIGDNFQAIQRPTNIHAYSAGLFYEQILTSSWKMRNSLQAARRIEDRPMNVSFLSRQAFALSDRLFLEGQASYVRELKNTPLQNERGYFDIKGAKVSLTAEPIYDFLISASFGISVETENDPRTNQIVQVGSDQFGLGLSYRVSQLLFNLQSAYSITNTNVSSLRLSGGLTWEI